MAFTCVRFYHFVSKFVGKKKVPAHCKRAPSPSIGGCIANYAKYISKSIQICFNNFQHIYAARCDSELVTTIFTVQNPSVGVSSKSGHGSGLKQDPLKTQT